MVYKDIAGRGIVPSRPCHPSTRPLLADLLGIAGKISYHLTVHPITYPAIIIDSHRPLIYNTLEDMKKAKIVKLESKEKYQRLFSKDSGTCGVKSGHVILKPGENIGVHSTNEREEVIVILKGKGEASSGGERTLKIEKNAVLYIPPSAEHDIKNTGKDVLEYIFITSQAQDL